MILSTHGGREANALACNARGDWFTHTFGGISKIYSSNRYSLGPRGSAGCCGLKCNVDGFDSNMSICTLHRTLADLRIRRSTTAMAGACALVKTQTIIAVSDYSFILTSFKQTNLQSLYLQYYSLFINILRDMTPGYDDTVPACNVSFTAAHIQRITSSKKFLPFYV